MSKVLYQKLCKEVERLEAEIKHNRERRAGAVERIYETTAAIEEAEQGLGEALVGEDTKKAEALRKQIADLRERSLRHDELLMAGLDDQLESLETALAAAELERDEAFSTLAKKWLDAEIGQHDRAVAELRLRLGRLLACHNMLIEIGRQDAYRDAVGAAYTYIPRSRITTIEGFDAKRFQDGAFGHSKVIHDAVEAEITGKE